MWTRHKKTGTIAHRQFSSAHRISKYHVHGVIMAVYRRSRRRCCMLLYIVDTNAQVSQSSLTHGQAFEKEQKEEDERERDERERETWALFNFI